MRLCVYARARASGSSASLPNIVLRSRRPSWTNKWKRCLTEAYDVLPAVVESGVLVGDDIAESFVVDQPAAEIGAIASTEKCSAS